MTRQCAKQACSSGDKPVENRERGEAPAHTLGIAVTSKTTIGKL